MKKEKDSIGAYFRLPANIIEIDNNYDDPFEISLSREL